MIHVYVKAFGNKLKSISQQFIMCLPRMESKLKLKTLCLAIGIHYSDFYFAANTNNNLQ